MKSTKRTFWMSVLAVVLCVAMLVGTTFAWFTDSVSSGKNKITAGNLDIEVTHTSASVTSAETIQDDTELFRDVNGGAMLWEPGAMSYENFTVSNVGNLALKYQLAMNITDYNALDGHTLKEVLKVKVLSGDDILTTVNRDAVAALDWSATTATLDVFQNSANLVAGASDEFQVIVYWQPTESDNTWNANNGQVTSDTNALFIEFGIDVFATQLTSESDSFDNQYDAGTPWLGGTDDAGLEANTDAEAKTVSIESAEQLASLAKAVNAGTSYNGFTVTLERDIDLNNVEWIQIDGAGKNIVFDGNGKTILNLKVSNGHDAGFFKTGSGCTVKDLSFDKATVSGVGRIAVVVGHGMCAKVENCTVKNSSITALVTNNDDGDKAGAIVGYLSAEPNAWVKGCTVENCTVKGYRDVGSLVGLAQGTGEVSGNTVKDCVVINDRTNNYKGYDADAKYDANELIGECSSAVTVSNNTATNVKVNVIAPVAAGATAAETKTAVTAAITSAGSGDTVVLPAVDQTIDLSGTTLNGSGVTVVGNKDIEVKATSTANADGVTFENVNFTVGNDTYNRINGNVTFKNCSFDGLVNVYDNSKFIDCTFTNSTSGKYLAHVYGGTALFDGCTFNGSNRCVYIYTDGANANATFTDCTFKMTTTGKAAIMVNHNENNGVSTVTINNCTQTGGNNSGEVSEPGETCVYNGLWGVKHVTAGQLLAKITVDGAVVYNNLP